MKEFFLILFFSKWLLLTPEAVDIAGEIVLTPAEPLTAITPGAGVHVDLGDFAPEVGTRQTGMTESMRILDERIRLENVRGYLFTDQGEPVVLDLAFFSLEKDRAWMVLTSSSGIPTDLEFVRLSIQSGDEIRNVLVYWKNFSL